MKIETNKKTSSKHLAYRQEVEKSQNFESMMEQKQGVNNPTGTASLTAPNSLVDKQLQWNQNPTTLLDKKNSKTLNRNTHYANIRGQTKKLSGLNQSGYNPSHRMGTAKGNNELNTYKSLIHKYSKKYNLDPNLVAGLMQQESGFKANATSHCGAMGLMQLMPGTAKFLGVENAYDPEQNIEGGTKYLRQMLDKFDGNVILALAAYNSGPHNVEKYGNRVPPFAETQNYVRAVASHTNAIRSSRGMV